MIDTYFINEATPLIKTTKSDKRPIIIWGAGLHGRWLMEQIGTRGIGFIDSNPTKHGTFIAGKPVYSPNELQKFNDARVWIAVLSDFRNLARRLEQQGRTEGCGFDIPFKRGKLHQISQTLDEHLALLKDLNLEGKTALEVGSGGQLFASLMLIHLGVGKIVLTDVVTYNDLNDSNLDTYKHFIEILKTKLGPSNNCRQLTDYLNRIEFIHEPISASSLPYPNESFDIVFNTGVMEHVDSPQQAISEFYRTLAKNGLVICMNVGIHDHRANDPDSGFTPWSFLHYTDEQWGKFEMNAYHQNRWRAVEFRHAFQDSNFDILKYQTKTDQKIAKEQFDTVAPRFKKFTRDEISELGLNLVALKQK